MAVCVTVSRLPSANFKELLLLLLLFQCHVCACVANFKELLLLFQCHVCACVANFKELLLLFQCHVCVCS